MGEIVTMTEFENQLDTVLDKFRETTEIRKERFAKDLTTEQVQKLCDLSAELCSACARVIAERSEKQGGN